MSKLAIIFPWKEPKSWNKAIADISNKCNIGYLSKNKFTVADKWATKVLRHLVIFEYLGQISFLISTILPPPPFSMLDFLSLEFTSFLYNIEKGEGGLALNINRIWNRISDMLQLALDSVNCLNYFCRPLY